MWLSSMLLTLSSVMAKFINGYVHANTVIEDITLIGTEIGFVGFLSNIMQLTMDQLPDASTEEIISVLRWLAWTFFSSFAVMNYTLFCVDSKYQLIGILLVSTGLTLAVCSDFLFNHHLAKEPATKNPFKLVFNVVKYAIHTKQPRCRSAFTSCEDERPSRIDYGKNKFGGPYTTEEVEDVKTFFRLLVVVVISGALIGPALFLDYASTKLINKFLDPEKVVEGCYTAKDLTIINVVCGLLSVPMYEFVLQPIFYTCIPTVKSHWKIFLGLSLLLLKVLASMSIDLIAQLLYKQSKNNTMQCLFNDSVGIYKDVLDYRYFSLFEVSDTCFTILMVIGITEFLCAQIPYSMKGVFIGILLSIVGVFSAVGVAAFIPFTLDLSIWNKGVLSCGFWFYFSEAVVIGTGMFLAMGIFKWYKKRRREDVLPNEHVFAERYYSS